MLTVLLDRGALDLGDLDFATLERAHPPWRSYDATAPTDTAARIANADIVISNKVWLGDAEMAAAPGLRLICVCATGTNNVDLAAAHRRGIAVCNVRGYATPAVVQHTYALMLALATRLPDYQQAVRQGRWSQSNQFCLLDYPISELSGKTLGIVGYGVLGRGVATVGQALGMKVSIAQLPHRPARMDSRPLRVPWDLFLSQVDVLSLHCPLTAQTHHLIDASTLARMKQGALLINTARGGLIDETALVAALSNGHLGGAGLDVLSLEPPPTDHPLLASDIPRLIITPHIAWGSRESRQRLVDEVVRNIAAFEAGEVRNGVGES